MQPCIWKICRRPDHQYYICKGVPSLLLLKGFLEYPMDQPAKQQTWVGGPDPFSSLSPSQASCDWNCDTTLVFLATWIKQIWGVSLVSSTHVLLTIKVILSKAEASPSMSQKSRTPFSVGIFPTLALSAQGSLDVGTYFI